jgi:plasmid stabilization system protein ParE
MTTEIEWTRRARRDLLEIGDLIARDKPGVASSWVRRLIDAVERIALFPSSGRAVPELDRPDIREVIFENYRIVDLVGKGRISILTVFESHRRLATQDLNTESSQ